MNHLCALKHPATGKWAYCRNGVPTGYCDNGRVLTTDQEFLKNACGGETAYERYIQPHREAAKAGKYHDGGHETEEEARECYKQYTLDFNLRFKEDSENASQQHRCRVCNSWTSGYVQIGGYELIILCAEHRNRETVATLFEVGEIWES